MEENITVCGGVEVKQKKCKNINCGIMFTPERPMQTTCCPFPCAIEYSKQLQAKKQGSEKRKAKKEFNENDRVLLRAKAQRLANKYARLRDQYENGYRCCTCGITKGKMDGGHFLPTSSYSAIRYNTNQIHQQCVGCNQFRHGMPKEYRTFMIEKYGDKYVEKLESLKGITRGYSTQYLQKLIKVLLKKTKRVENMI